jgi:hypothetical protein
MISSSCTNARDLGPFWHHIYIMFSTCINALDLNAFVHVEETMVYMWCQKGPRSLAFVHEEVWDLGPFWHHIYIMVSSTCTNAWYLGPLWHYIYAMVSSSCTNALDLGPFWDHIYVMVSSSCTNALDLVLALKTSIFYSILKIDL